MTSDAQLAAVEYADAMDLLVGLASAFKALPLDWLLATVSHAETLGPILHPSAYQVADLGSQRVLIEAAIAFRSRIHDIEGQLAAGGWGP